MSTAYESEIAKKSVRAKVALAQRAENEENRLKMLLAMAEGLQHKPPMDPERSKSSRSTKKHIYKEAKRRYQHMQLLPDDAPRTGWPKGKLENWLRQHPITNPECIAFLQIELQRHFGTTPLVAEGAVATLLVPVASVARVP